MTNQAMNEANRREATQALAALITEEVVAELETILECTAEYMYSVNSGTYIRDYVADRIAALKGVIV